MKKKLIALLMGTTLALAACGGNDNDAKPAGNGNDTGTETASNGDAEKFYQNKCSQCHGQNLEGGVGNDLTSVGSRMSVEEIEDIIAKGSGAMPANLLTGDEAKEVAEWLAEKK